MSRVTHALSSERRVAHTRPLVDNRDLRSDGDDREEFLHILIDQPDAPGGFLLRDWSHIHGPMDAVALLIESHPPRPQDVLGVPDGIGNSVDDLERAFRG